MDRIIIRHISGSKSGVAEEFELKDLKSLTFGRSPASDISYDSAKDDLVSTNHARLDRDSVEPDKFTLVDLASKNKTFVNGKVVSAGTYMLQLRAVSATGDVVRSIRPIVVSGR